MSKFPKFPAAVLFPIFFNVPPVVVTAVVFRTLTGQEVEVEDTANKRVVNVWAEVAQQLNLPKGAIRLTMDGQDAPFTVFPNSASSSNPGSHIIDPNSPFDTAANPLGNCETGIIVKLSSYFEEREKVLKKLQANGNELSNVAEEFRSDREVVLAAVQQNGFSLDWLHASEELRGDREVVKAALFQQPDAIKYVLSETLRDDFEVIKTAVQSPNNYRNDYSTRLFGRADNSFWSFVGPSCRNNFELMKLGIAQDPFALEYCSEDLQDNVELVELAVEQDGNALEFASARLRDDVNVVGKIENLGTALGFAGPTVRSNREIVLRAVNDDPRAVGSASEPLLNDFEVLLAALDRVRDGPILTTHGGSALRPGASRALGADDVFYCINGTALHTRIVEALKRKYHPENATGVVFWGPGSYLPGEELYNTIKEEAQTDKEAEKGLLSPSASEEEKTSSRSFLSST